MSESNVPGLDWMVSQDIWSILHVPFQENLGHSLTFNPATSEQKLDLSKNLDSHLLLFIANYKILATKLRRLLRISLSFSF